VDYAQLVQKFIYRLSLHYKEPQQLKSCPTTQIYYSCRTTLVKLYALKYRRHAAFNWNPRTVGNRTPNAKWKEGRRSSCTRPV